MINEIQKMYSDLIWKKLKVSLRNGSCYTRYNVVTDSIYIRIQSNGIDMEYGVYNVSRDILLGSFDVDRIVSNVKKAFMKRVYVMFFNEEEES